MRQDVDTNTKRQAVRDGLQLWVDWEKKTKSLYQSMYTELVNAGEAAAAAFLTKFVSAVDDELAGAEL